MSLTRTVTALALVAATLSGCNKDSTGPSTDAFPSLPAQLLANECVRGDRAPGQPISGSVSTSDCPLGDGSFYETWRIRVTTSGTYTFLASSAFDNVLILRRVDSYTNTAFTGTTIAGDDDSGGGTNASINGVTLAAGVDYFLLVNGFSATDTGPYTVAFSSP